ncbi:MAG: AAA family ATPase [Blastomonas sp.]|uniref:hypothetical protein n=1 Tax=Blastomonas sp. TaxID=1909299 RepID=UPI00258484CB|nr:hypothetical protein [Blastomonas sp.]MCO5792826.1 AAA family ATPase [Blastomonas sp.]
MTNEQTILLDRIIKFYSQSHDFNGMPVSKKLSGDLDPADIIALIRADKADLVRGDMHPNPHIKAFDAEPIETQIEKIEMRGLDGCLYPSPAVLAEKHADAVELSAGPYTRALQLGAPQLAFRAFDLRALEWYRNDPRFKLIVDDIHGRVVQKKDTQIEGRAIVRDQLDFFEFGFAYNDKLDRAVAAFIRYLHDLPEPLQAEFHRYELDGKFTLHPDFYRTQIVGDWPEKISIYDAFLEEKKHINAICTLIGKPKIFRTEFPDYERPDGFGILLRPTKKEYRDFSLMLDQLLSDDINKKFFENDIPGSKMLTDDEGNKVPQPIGTITLLETWIKKFFRPKDQEPMDKMFSNLRAVRNERMKPAHKIEDNEFDQQYVKKQRELISKAYGAVHTLRMVLENHPKASAYEVPDYIKKADVWTY